MRYDFQGYLEAKRTVDGRALNQRVWEMLAARLAGVREILDIGCGTGAMRDRLLRTGLLGRGVRYLGVDKDPGSLALARERAAGEVPGGFQSDYQQADLFELPPSASCDLVIAAAFLDLVDLGPALAQLLALLRPGGLAYLPINFDGLTVFEPPHPLDRAIIPAYHGRISAGGGDSRTGRKLFAALKAAGAVLLAAGASDWLVFAQAGGDYPDREKYFLEQILLFFEDALENHSELPAGQLRQWLAARRSQLSRAELVYIAHQLDFLAQKPV